MTRNFEQSAHNVDDMSECEREEWQEYYDAALREMTDVGDWDPVTQKNFDDTI